jgi:hypothetical protein
MYLCKGDSTTDYFGACGLLFDKSPICSNLYGYRFFLLMMVMDKSSTQMLEMHSTFVRLIEELSVLARWRYYGEEKAMELYPKYKSLIETWRGRTYEQIKQELYEKYK